MNKSNSLRRALNAAVPSLVTDPDKLLVFIDTGNIIATGAASDSFDYAYTLNVMLLDFTGDADIVFAALIAWVRRNQSDLLTNDDLRKTGISFEADRAGRRCDARRETNNRHRKHAGQGRIHFREWHERGGRQERRPCNGHFRHRRR
jgi:hypothetical protein